MSWARPVSGVIVTLHLVALALYGLATALTLAPFMGFRPAPRALTIAIPCAGAAVHLVAVSQLTLVGLGPALYLLQFRELKARRFGQIFQLFPPLERLDQLNRVALVAGFPALTLGVLLALGYGAQFSGGLHVAKAQLVWGIFTWVVLGWAVWVRVVRHWAGRRAALASIAGFGAVLLVYVALKLTQPGAERFL